jgi:hypothetical protein
MTASDPTRARKRALLTGLLSLAVLLLSIVAMAQRVNSVVSTKDRVVYQPIRETDFTFASRDVTLEFVPDVGEGPGQILVTYGDQQLPIRVTIPPEPAKAQLPLPRAHDDWFQVLRFTEGTGEELAQIDRSLSQGEIVDRLVIVTRIPPPGTDARTYGRIWRKEWKFAFYELMPDGTIRREQLGFPTSRRHQPPNPGELVEGTWQFGAALMVMPKGTTPSPRFTDDGLRAMGWTRPVAVLGACGLTASIIMFAAAYVRRPGQASNPTNA